MKNTLAPQVSPPRRCAQSPGPSRKRTGEDALEAFARLKKACLKQTHDPESLTDKLAGSPCSLDMDLEPEGPTLPAKDPVATEVHGDDMDGYFETGVRYFDRDRDRRKKEEWRTRSGPIRHWSAVDWLRKKSIFDVVSR
ncbi:hypothetical protein NDU88_000912 [Pleurodeles waltl]|uniref:Uncharacterized protein n=1 Tax=Pleurodeles waltl TaxID=8319 RepID=A0AAV7USJ8_PLEWA|nr:hypothetical protein NDU88_000912 [Pleurodeles waltl]